MARPARSAETSNMTARTTHARVSVPLRATGANARRARAPVRSRPEPAAALEATTCFARPPLRVHTRANFFQRRSVLRVRGLVRKPRRSTQPRSQVRKGLPLAQVRRLRWPAAPAFRAATVPPAVLAPQKGRTWTKGVCTRQAALAAHACPLWLDGLRDATGEACVAAALPRPRARRRRGQCPRRLPCPPARRRAARRGCPMPGQSARAPERLAPPAAEELPQHPRKASTGQALPAGSPAPRPRPEESPAAQRPAPRTRPPAGPSRRWQGCPQGAPPGRPLPLPKAASTRLRPSPTAPPPATDSVRRTRNTWAAGRDAARAGRAARGPPKAPSS